VLVYEIMVGWIHQNLDQDGGVGLLSSGNAIKLLSGLVAGQRPCCKQDEDRSMERSCCLAASRGGLVE